MISAGIDLGGTTIKIGVVQDGALLHSQTIQAASDQSMRKRLPIIESAINRAFTNLNLSLQALSAVGLAFPSIVDNKHKKILTRYVKFTDADEVDLNSWVTTCWGVPLALENDARAALVGEWQFGAGRGYQHIVMITLGTGVGSGVLLDGKLVRGAHHVGGNLGGHTIVNVGGSECNCGSLGCVETEASGWALHDNYKNDPKYRISKLSSQGKISYRKVFQYASQGDTFAKYIKDHSLKVWAANALNFVHNFDPEVLILGGGIMKSADQIIPFIQSFIDEYAWQPKGSIKVVAAEHENHAGILGMGYLAEQECRRLATPSKSN